MIKYSNVYTSPATPINPMGYYVAECETEKCGNKFVASSVNLRLAKCNSCGRMR